jgi:hypothetical protein
VLLDKVIKVALQSDVTTLQVVAVQEARVRLILVMVELVSQIQSLELHITGVAAVAGLAIQGSAVMAVTVAAVAAR